MQNLGGTPTQRGTRKPRTSKLQSATEIGINIGHPSGNQILTQQYTSLSGNQIVEHTQHILSNSQQFQSASTAVQHQLTNLISGTFYFYNFPLKNFSLVFVKI